MLKDVIEQLLQPRIQCRVWFADVGFPALVIFCETRFDLVRGVVGADVCFRTAPIARVDAVGFAEELRGGLAVSRVHFTGLGVCSTSFTVGIKGRSGGRSKVEKVCRAVAQHLSSGLV